jgi:hypothetical protein
VSSYYKEIAEQVARILSRDEGRKKRVLADCAHLGIAMDAADSAESSQEAAACVIKGLGLKIGGDSDAVEVLDFYLAGRRHALQLRSGMKASALDGAQCDNDVISRYIRGET